MGICPNQLCPAPVPLQGFTGDFVQLMGAITLSVLVRKAPRIVETMANFLVVKAPSTYNAILGCLTLNNLRKVTSTYHIKMKFPTDLRVGEVHGEQVLSWELKHEVKVVLVVEEVGERSRLPSRPILAEWDKEVHDEQAEPNEPLELVLIDQHRLEQMVQVRTKLDPELRLAMKRLLIDHQDVFA